jgi:sugar transferase (PEP-CTERM/EpsH1 system associated)
VKRLNILFVCDRVCLPLTSGGKIRTYNLVKWLSRDHSVDYVGFYSNEEERELAPNLKEFVRNLTVLPRKRRRSLLDIGLSLFSRKPLTMVDYDTPQMLAELKRALEGESYDAAIYECLHSAQYSPKLRFDGVSVYSSQNVESEIIKRVAETERTFLRRFYAGTLWRKLERVEHELWRHFGYALAVTEKDANEMRRVASDTEAIVVPNGVDCEQFTPDGRSETGRELIHFASMDWLPNVQAMLWFYKDIFPLVRREVPDATFTIGGANPPPEIVSLGKAAPAVTVTGRVPDTQPYLKRASLCVVPLQSGSGSRLKILEAMAVGLPVVSTAVGAEGLNLEPGREIAIGDTPEEFARAVVDLLRDSGKREELRRNGRARVERDYDWKQIVGRFSEQLSEIAS